MSVKLQTPCALALLSFTLRLRVRSADLRDPQVHGHERGERSSGVLDLGDQVADRCGVNLHLTRKCPAVARTKLHGGEVAPYALAHGR